MYHLHVKKENLLNINYRYLSERVKCLSPFVISYFVESKLYKCFLTPVNATPSHIRPLFLFFFCTSRFILLSLSLLPSSLSSISSPSRILCSRKLKNVENNISVLTTRVELRSKTRNKKVYTFHINIVLRFVYAL